MKDRDPSLYLIHVLESSELARAYVEGVDFRQFRESQQLQDAVIRRIEIIGEAVKNLPAEMRDAAPGVPWRRLARDRWRFPKPPRPTLVRRARVHPHR